MSLNPLEGSLDAIAAPTPHGHKEPKMSIDPHAHIAPESFIQDVRKKRFGKAVTIEKGKLWELLVVRSKILGHERVHKNPQFFSR